MQTGATTRAPTQNISRSHILFDRACAVMPGGNSRDTIFFAPHPLYASHGDGCRVTDVDGVERIDFVNNYSSLIHGHRNAAINDAVIQQLDRIAAVGMPTEEEIKLAELLCDRIASVEKIRFTNSGTEAVMMALKAARFLTSKKKIAKIEGAYHGSYLGVEPLDDPSYNLRAMNPEDIVLIEYNDVAGAREILESHKDDLAAVIIDPLMSRIGYTAASVCFLEMLREVTTNLGALLIFDEVYSFRVASGGIQQKRGVYPDITALGKIIGGCFPIGAVGGRSDIMEIFDPSRSGGRLPHGGTYNANPISMAAGLAAMTQMTPAAYAHLNQLGEHAREGVREIIQEADAYAQVIGEGSLFAIAPSRLPIRNSRDYRNCETRTDRLEAFHRQMLNEGIFMAPRGTFVLSTPMTETEIESLLRAVRQSIHHLV